MSESFGENSEFSELNISPDPNILIALASTPLKPIDALCELIDNALDSFRAAEREGMQIDQKWIQITLPTAGQIQRGEGVIRVIDNGAGLDREGLAGALKAGYSSKYKYGSLGLFGVGFNIATAKLGRRTIVTTVKKGAVHALRAVVDLPELKRTGQFLVPLTELPKDSMSYGSCVEITDWWPSGTPNEKFALDLAKLSKSKMAELLGRRYATILRANSELRINMIINDEPVRPFEHCVWSSQRSVTRQGIGEIPAKIEFNETLRNTRRCERDGSILRENEVRCEVCGGDEIATLKEVVRGWVGVQRFDDKSNFGVDLIRNGRAIRVAEKEAFFTFTDDLGQSELEYPIDQNTGRIIGEIHLDHVPVDFTKQDFERPSQEWQDAMRFIRGGGLQQKNREPGVANESPMGRIFSGYRRTKKFGKVDMYMGTYSEGGPTRISREVEAEYRARFDRREEGYFDDARWWDLVESASIPPVNPLIDCPTCGGQNPDGSYVCVGCGEILRGKACMECAIVIPQNASSCPTCGANQTPTIIGPWRCQSCSNLNAPTDDLCQSCDLQKGAPDPLSMESLNQIANRVDSLSFSETSFRFVDGGISEAISVNTFSMPHGYLKPFSNQPAVPSFSPTSPMNELNVYLDLSHPLFSAMGYTPEFAVANAVAQYLITVSGGSTRGRTVLNQTYLVLDSTFGESVSISIDSLNFGIQQLINDIVDALSQQEWVMEFYDDLLTAEKSYLVSQLQRVGRHDDLESLRANGEYLRYVPIGALARMFASNSNRWFGSVFTTDLANYADFAPEAVEAAQHRSVRSIQRALEECAEFLEAPMNDERVMRRIKSSVQFLDSRLA
jgi:hypothetical protein